MTTRLSPEKVVISCIVIVVALLVFLFVKSCKEEPKPQAPTVEKVLLDTLRAAFARMELRDQQLQQKVDSLNSLVKSLEAKQQQAKQKASTAIAQYDIAKAKKDTAAAITACDSLKKEHNAYVQHTEEKNAEVAAIIATKDEQISNANLETDNQKMQVLVLETSNKEKDNTITQQDKKLKKETKRANRNGTLAKIFGGTTILAIIITIVQILSPI